VKEGGACGEGRDTLERDFWQVDVVVEPILSDSDLLFLHKVHRKLTIQWTLLSGIVPVQVKYVHLVQPSKGLYTS
jgi:hypothetical protein